MCENVPHVYREHGESLADYANRARGPMLFPCRQCAECADAAEGIICGDMVAARETSTKALLLLLTYSDEKLRLAGRDPERFLKDIPAAVEDRRQFMYEFRKQLRRMNPLMLVTIKQKPVTEIAMIAGADGKPPRIGTPPRVHHHIVLYFDLEWNDPVRQLSEAARWEDFIFPRFRLDWLYDHVLETKAEAKARGGRIRKTAIPWPFGFIGYEIPRGGESRYLAKYCSKCMRMRGEYVKKHPDEITAEQWLDWHHAEQSKRSMRGTRGIGYKYYAQQAELAAQQGLPASLYFLPALGDMRVEDGALVGGRYAGEKRPRFMLQRVGRQRCYINAYDREWSRLWGDRPQPVGPSWRQIRSASGREKTVMVYGMAEAREAVAKDDDRRFIAARDRLIARKRRDRRKLIDLDRATRGERRAYHIDTVWQEAGSVRQEMEQREMLGRVVKLDKYEQQAESAQNKAYGVTAEILLERSINAMKPEKLDGKLRRMGNRKGVGYDPDGCPF